LVLYKLTNQLKDLESKRRTWRKLSVQDEYKNIFVEINGGIVGSNNSTMELDNNVYYDFACEAMIRNAPMVPHNLM